MGKCPTEIRSRVTLLGPMPLQMELLIGGNCLALRPIVTELEIGSPLLP